MRYLPALLAAFFVLARPLAPEAARAQPAQAAQAAVGDRAPGFTLEGADGETYRLSDFEGRFVVLEWLNFRCPYVGKHYGSGNMQRLQETYTGEGVVWLSIVSSAPGKPGHYAPAAMNAEREKRGGRQTAILMDPTGTVGRTYGARTTPHMYVVDPEGTLIYKGGIDDTPSTDEADVAGAANYVRMALDQAMRGEEVQVKAAPPYGCHIPYAAP